MIRSLVDAVKSFVQTAGPIAKIVAGCSFYAIGAWNMVSKLNIFNDVAMMDRFVALIINKDTNRFHDFVSALEDDPKKALLILQNPLQRSNVIRPFSRTNFRLKLDDEIKRRRTRDHDTTLEDLEQAGYVAPDLHKAKIKRDFQEIVLRHYGEPELVSRLPKIRGGHIVRPERFSGSHIESVIHKLVEKPFHDPGKIVRDYLEMVEKRRIQNAIRKSVKNPEEKIDEKRAEDLIRYAKQLVREEFFGTLLEKTKYTVSNRSYESDFETLQGVLDIKCYSYNITDKDWAQVAFYAYLSKGCRHRSIWIYNPLTGHLYSRKYLNNSSQ